MCLFFSIVFLGPRTGIFFWWLIEPGRWNTAFDTIIWPFLGFVFLPWTTLMFVAVAPFGNVQGWDWAWLTLALLADIIPFGAGGYSNRQRLAGYYP